MGIDVQRSRRVGLASAIGSPCGCGTPNSGSTWKIVTLCEVVAGRGAGQSGIAFTQPTEPQISLLGDRLYVANQVAARMPHPTRIRLARAWSMRNRRPRHRSSSASTSRHLEMMNLQVDWHDMTQDGTPKQWSTSMAVAS
jgi:hypothetical protein